MRSDPPHSAHDASRHKTAKNQIVGLDLIRFGAACLVLLHHLGWLAYLKTPGLVHDSQVLFVPGWIGVEIFFVLSGFVIAFSASRSSPWSFVRSRIIRLYPAAWICSTFTLLIATVVGRYPLRPLLPDWLHSFLLYPNSHWIDTAYWTLGIECAFYAIVLVHLLLGCYRWIGFTFTGVALMSDMFWIYILLHKSAVAAGDFDMYALYPNSRMLLLQHGSFFAIGVLLWQVLLDRVTVARLAGLAIALPGAVTEIWFHASYIRSYFHGSGRAYTWYVPLFLWIATMILLVCMVRFNKQIGQLLGHRGASMARDLGLVTYPLYLVHQRVGFIFLYRMDRFLPQPIALILVLCMAVVGAWIIAFYMEIPIQRFLSKLLHRRVSDRELPAASTP